MAVESAIKLGITFSGKSSQLLATQGQAILNAGSKIRNIPILAPFFSMIDKDSQSIQEDVASENEERKVAAITKFTEDINELVEKCKTPEVRAQIEAILSPGEARGLFETIDASQKVATDVKSEAQAGPESNARDHQTPKEQDRDVTTQAKVLDPNKEGQSALIKELSELRQQYKQGNKKKSMKNVMNLVKLGLLGATGLGVYLSGEQGRKAQRESAEERKRDLEKLQQQVMQMDDNDPAKAKAVKQLKYQTEMMTEQNKQDLIKQASDLVKKREDDRLKAATDIGMNLGNFAQIFNAKANRGSLNQVRDLSSLIDEKERGLGNLNIF
jgi:hypothetical protein